MARKKIKPDPANTKGPNNAADVKIVDTAKPLPVTLEADRTEVVDTVAKSENRTLLPTTTDQEDITTAGQRRINMIWEFTQAFIAIAVVTITLFIDAYVTIRAIGGKELTVTQLVGISNLTALSMLVVGFYFSRTNHQAIGGEGKKPSQKYEGR